MRLATNGVLAFRGARLQELGRVPRLHVLRRQLGAARLRLPRVPRQQGVLPRRRAALPADRSGADAARCDRRPARRRLRRPRRRRATKACRCRCTPAIRSRSRRCSGSSRTSRPSSYDPVYGPPKTIDGFKLVDGRASYGVGLETFALGFPIHFDWSWRTLFNKDYEDYVFAYQGIQEGHDRQQVVPEAAILGLDRVRLLKSRSRCRAVRSIALTAREPRAARLPCPSVAAPTSWALLADFVEHHLPPECTPISSDTSPPVRAASRS